MISKFLAGKAIVAVMLGNSVGMGYYSTDYEVIPALSDTSKSFTIDSRTSDLPGGQARLLRSFLRNKNESSQLINLSGDGWDTNDQLGISLPSSSAPKHRSSVEVILEMRPKPDVVFIPLQINDANHKIPLTVFYKNTIKIVDSLQAEGIDTVLVKENYTHLDGYSAYIDMVDIIAGEKNVPVIDTYTPSLGKPDLLFDALHPNDKGHELIFNQYRNWFLSSAAFEPSK